MQRDNATEPYARRVDPAFAELEAAAGPADHDLLQRQGGAGFPGGGEGLGVPARRGTL